MRTSTTTDPARGIAACILLAAGGVGAAGAQTLPIVWSANVHPAGGSIRSVDISDDGARIAVGFGSVEAGPGGETGAGGIAAFEARSGVRVFEHLDVGGPVAGVDLSAGGLLAVAVEPGRLQVRSQGGSLVRTISTLHGEVTDIDFSPDDALVYASYTFGSERGVYMYRVSDGAMVGNLGLTTPFVTSLEFSPDGTQIAVIDQQEIRIFDSAYPGMALLIAAPHIEFPSSPGSCDVAWSPDGTMLASIGRRSVKVFRLSDLAVVLNATLPASDVGAAVAWSPDGATLLAAGGEGEAGTRGFVSKIDAETGVVLERYSQGIGRFVRDIEFGPGGGFAALVSDAVGTEGARVVVIDTGCGPDLTASALAAQPGYGVPNGVLNNDDFFYYLAEFGAGNSAVCDLTTGSTVGQPGYGTPNGVLDNDDFMYYLAMFSQGC